MDKGNLYKKLLLWGIILVCLSLFGLVLLHNSLSTIGYDKFSALLSDREKIRNFVASFGPLAPLAFIGLQIMQVVISPIPGEATGFIGGYLFGAFRGFIYSTIGLTLGSWLAFSISRLFTPYVTRRLGKTKNYDKFNFIVEHQGVIIAFIFFLLPGFPKDYLCYLLGLSLMPTSVFLIIVAVGRMPGTLMLALNGSKVFDQEYAAVFILLGIALAAVIFSYMAREKIYRLVQRLHAKNTDTKK
ncbi:MAG: VTT domain-containing protein [Deltaproteobacteria bacterium]|nr:VTT domain-containing protein [Deltaproteobacteria bacterium]MDP3029393.1 VTT domain-containing protein [Deltaproteobacteria bacterium]